MAANVPPLLPRAGPFSGWHAPDVTSRVRAEAARGEVPAPPAQVGQSFVPGAAPRNRGPAASPGPRPPRAPSCSGPGRGPAPVPGSEARPQPRRRDKNPSLTPAGAGAGWRLAQKPCPQRAYGPGASVACPVCQMSVRVRTKAGKGITRAAREGSRNGDV